VKKFFLYTFAAIFILYAQSAFSVSPASDQGATLFIGPATGTYTVGSTFSVSFYVNTADKFINVVDADILFPPDKLQVVSPSTGSSFINVWAIQPSYSNTEGTLSFRGAVPSPGVNTNAGLISTVVFRVKSVGTAAIRFAGRSKVLLNDGLGTNVLQQSQSAVYTLALPPPSGPTVSSVTHPDQSRWYAGTEAQFTWSGDAAATGYSYMISDEPIDIPDNIVDSSTNGIRYGAVKSGRHYFHIKALRGGVWGGTTHYAINVDAEPPAAFPVEVLPSTRTAQQQPVIKFFTTDAGSGLDHYEVKVIPLSEKKELPANGSGADLQILYAEAQSPYIPPRLSFGRYDIYVRAHDEAGNYREVTQRLDIVPALFEVVSGEGLEFRNSIFVPWSVFWGVGLFVLIALGIIARKLHWWHGAISKMHASGELPDDVDSKLRELKEYQRKYGKVAVFLMLCVIVSSLMTTTPAFAQTQRGLFAPPVITTISKDIFNDEIFYVGGRTSQPNVEVVLYVQKVEDGQTTSYRLAADEQGEWFYRHGGFLQNGGYLLWAQAQRGEELSPPSPQVTMTVAAHALQVGSSRLSYETVYVFTIALLSLIVLILAYAIWYHYHHGRRKHAAYIQQKGKIEESISRGFALLHRDIEEEIALLRRSAQGGELDAEGRARELELLKDFERVRRHVGDEVWELEKIAE
jgi:hypothetical protein